MTMYELSLEDGAGKALRRALRQTLKDAHDLMLEPQVMGVRIREASGGVKRARSLLRLARREIGEAAYSRELVVLRDATTALANVRRAVMDVKTIDALLSRVSPEDASAFAPIRATLVKRRDAWLADRGVWQSLQKVARTLDRSRARAAELPLDRGGWKAVAPGVERAYRGACRRAASGPEVLRSHRFRRAIKELAHQARFLRPIDPGALEAEARELARLARLLDEAHELTELAKVDWTEGDVLDTAAVSLLDDLVRRRCDELLAEAAPLAARLFAERPKDRSRRLEAAFRAARLNARTRQAASVKV